MTYKGIGTNNIVNFYGYTSYSDWITINVVYFNII